MSVRMPIPINQFFNYESIAVQIIGLGDYTWNYPWIQWNTGLISDGSEFQGYFVIFLDIFKSNVVEIVHRMSTLHIHICGPDCIQAFSSWML